MGHHHRVTAFLFSVGLLPFLLTATGCQLSAGSLLERQTERTFHARAGSVVKVELAGGAVTIQTGPPGVVQVVLHQAVDAGSEREADALLADYEVSATQSGDQIQAIGRRRRGAVSRLWQHNAVRINATITAPDDIRLDLTTSGGSIDVRGERVALVQAHTSGGSIHIDGGADSRLSTSGGSIKVGRASRTLQADTSGGSITVDYVGAAASDVNLGTSGGGIRVGVDPDAALQIDAATSGGRVRVEQLALGHVSRSTTSESSTPDRSHVRGVLNNGTGRLYAKTSGGSIVIRSAR
ncbi:MAG: hypothetical protein ABI051_15305 [Vicinamibacterales bacterium]